MKRKEPAFVAATLRWCNRQRAKKGKKPMKRLPKGKRHDAYSCPCGKATGLWVGGRWFGRDDSDIGDMIPILLTSDIAYLVGMDAAPGIDSCHLSSRCRAAHFVNRLPTPVQCFVKAFDDGELPQYEAKQ